MSKKMAILFMIKFWSMQQYIELFTAKIPTGIVMLINKIHIFFRAIGVSKHTPTIRIISTVNYYGHVSIYNNNIVFVVFTSNSKRYGE